MVRGADIRIELLAQRLVDVTKWLVRHEHVPGLPIGYFGPSTGVGAALSAADRQADIAAVVSRGGRTGLADDRLADIQVPTLLIVGGHDNVVLEHNQLAQAQMSRETGLAVVPGVVTPKGFESPPSDRQRPLPPQGMDSA